MSEETPVPEVVGLNVPGKTRSVAAPKLERGWLPGEAGYRGDPLEYGGVEFYLGEIERADKKARVKRYQRDLKAVGRAIDELQKTMQGEQDAADKEAKAAHVAKQLEENPELTTDEIDTEGVTGEIGEEREDYFDGELEKLLVQKEAIYDTFLSGAVVGWNRKAPFTTESLLSLDENDKINLSELLGERLLIGFNTVKNLQRRLKA